MILFDVNILIYAHREDQGSHSYFRERLESTIGSGLAFGLTPLVAAGFVRIVTNPQFQNGPTPLPQALSVIDSLAQLPQAHWIFPSHRHWEILSSLCRAAQAEGKAVADAQHAAIAIEHACTWVSRDSDFSRFMDHGLRWEHWSPP